MDRLSSQLRHTEDCTSWETISNDKPVNYDLINYNWNVNRCRKGGLLYLCGYPSVELTMNLNGKMFYLCAG